MMFLPNTGSNSVTMVEGVMAGPARATLTDIPVPGERPEGIDLSPVDLTTLEVTLEMPMGDGAGPGCLYWIGAM